MKKVLTTFLVVLTAVALSACSGFELGDGRMDAWKEVRKSEEATKQEFLKTKATEIQAELKGTKQNPTLKLTTYSKDGRKTGEAEMDLQPVLAELGIGKGALAYTYGVDLKKTDAPEGQISETFGSVGKAAKDIGNTPAAIIGTSGYFIREILSEAEGNTNIQGDTVTLDGSLNRSEVHATGQKNSASGGYELNRTEVVAEEPEELELEESETDIE